MDLPEKPIGLHAPYHGGLAIVVVCLGCAWLGTVIAVALSPALPFIAAEFGRNGDGAAVAQQLQTLPAIAMILGAISTGYFSERWGRRTVMLASLMVYALSGISGLGLTSLTSLIVARLVLGFAGGSLLTVSYALMGEYFEGSRRERILGFGSMMGSLSSVANLLVAGPLVDAFGWRAPFILYLPAFVIVPFAWVGIHRGRPPGASVELSWRPIIALWPILVLLTTYTIGMYMSVIQTPFLVVERHLGDATVIGFLVATTSVVAAVCAGFYGVMRPVLGFAGMFILISIALGTGMIVCVQAPDLPIFVLGCALLGLGTGLIEPTIASAALAYTSEPYHDRAMGAVIMALFLGQFLNPVVLRPLREVGGTGFAIGISGVMFLAGGVAFTLFATRRWSRQRRSVGGRRPFDP